MAEGTGTRVAQSFDNTSTSGAVSMCCKNVKGEWKSVPKAYPNGVPELLGNPQASVTYYFDTIPKGLMYSAKMRHKWHVTGRLLCKCMDDGRVLSETAFDKDLTFDAQTPFFSQNISKKFLGGPLGWASLAYDAYKVGKLGYDIYTENPELIKELGKAAAPQAEKALEEIKNSADSLCKSKHKPCNDQDPKPPGDNKPGTSTPGQGEGEALIS